MINETWKEYYIRINKTNIFNNIVQWATDRNLIEGATKHAQMVKLMEEVGELSKSIAKGKDPADDIGDCVVVLTIIAEQHGLSIEKCIEISYNEIRDRKGKMINGMFVKEGDF